MSTVHREDAETVLRCKGAPRELLERCTRVRRDGLDHPLDATTRAEILDDALSREAMPRRRNDAGSRARPMRVLGVRLPRARRRDRRPTRPAADETGGATS
jgi:hypothetical protein